jgi:hypothetical protein
MTATAIYYAGEGSSELQKELAIIVSCYSADLIALSNAAKQLGKQSDWTKYTQLAAGVAAALNASFWNASARSFGSQASNAMAVVLGIADASHVAAATNAALANIAAQGNVTTPGDIGNRYIWELLGTQWIADGIFGKRNTFRLRCAGSANATEIAAAVLNRSNSPGYGWMIANGETTLAETWNDDPGDSHIHVRLV